MAKNSTPEAEAPVVETEAPVETVVTPEGEAPAETPAEDVEVPIDLTAFNTAVTEAIEGMDTATGDVAEAFVAKVRTAYQALDGIKAKNAAKARLAEDLKGYLKALNGPAAKAVMQLTEQAAVAGKSGSSAPKAAADPTEAFVGNIAALTLGLYLAQRSVPEGVEAEAAIAKATEQAGAAFEEALTVFNSDNQETENPLIRAAIKVATVKSRKASGPRVATADRRDLGAHIEEAFAPVEVGTFLTVAEIRKFESSGYGQDHPSAGAITNRLEPKSGKPTTIPGIKVERRDGKLGAVKVEAPAEA